MTLVIGNRSELQPGDRPPAPGDLWLVQAFVNSRWDLERDLQDEFGDREGLATWLVDEISFPPARR